MVFMPVIILSGTPKLQKSFYFCIAFSGYSAVRLAHLVWDQRAAGSNPATPTILINAIVNQSIAMTFFFIVEK